MVAAIDLVIRVSVPKTEMPIGDLNDFNSKTSRRRRMKVSNLEAPGHAVLRRFATEVPIFFSGQNYEFCNKRPKTL